jgi:hypothetical protein
MTPNKADGTKCLKTLIGHHGVDVQSSKSIWTLMVGGCSFAFSTWHGEVSRMKKIMNEKKNNFLMDKTKNRNKNEKIKLQTHIGIEELFEIRFFITTKTRNKK